MKTIYLNLDDDVAKIIAKIKAEKSSEVVLVMPKHSFIFSDSINLRLLKKQVDLLRKRVSVLTMDEKGQMFAEEAGFELKFLPKTLRTSSVADIRPRKTKVPESQQIPRRTRLVAQPSESLDPIGANPGHVASKREGPKSNVSTVKRSIASPIVQESTIDKFDNVFVPPENQRLELPPRRSHRKLFIGFVALSLITFVFLALVVLPNASINVHAKAQPLSRDLDVTVSLDSAESDASMISVPAVAVNEARPVSGEFQANGKKEVGSKAEGRVAIYNFTGNPLTLKSATTTLTVGNKTYYFKQDATGLRPVSSTGDDANASVADIIAAEGGEPFNLPAGTRVEIANQAFGSQPQRLYAKTVSQVVGGSSRFISVVSGDDLSKAKEQMTKQVVDEINGQLKTRSVALVDGAYTITIPNFTPDRPEGTESPNFAASMQVEIKGLAFNEDNLKQLVRQRLIMSMGKNRKLQDSSQDTVIYKIKNLDLENGKVLLSIHYESQAIPALDIAELQREITGKSKAEASEVILANPDVETVEITLHPIWQRSLPRMAGKIDIQVQE